MIYFISGHRDLSYEDFEEYYIPKIQKIFDWDEYPEFIIGDCDGVDKFAMDYLINNYYQLPFDITIYHMYNSPRNTPAGKSVEYYSRNIEDLSKEGIYTVVKFIGGFKSDEERNAAMTKASDSDLAFIKDNRWDSGTAQNIKRRHGIK